MLLTIVKLPFVVAIWSLKWFLIGVAAALLVVIL
jgi:hypothetical protein